MNTLTKATIGGVLAALLTTTPSLADQNRQAGLYWLAGEIRGQIAEVHARAQAVLPFCDDADDIRDELAQLSRDLTRFEQRLGQGIHRGKDLDRLARLAERVHEHACELKEELADAIDDLRDDHRHRQFHRNGRFQRINHHHAAHGRAPVHYVGLDLDDLEDAFEDRREAIEEQREALEELREDRREARSEAIEEYYDDLEDRFDNDRFRRRAFVPRNGRAIYSYPQPYYLQPKPRYVYPWGAKRRGVRVTVGRLGPSITFSGGGVQVAPPVPAVRPLPAPPVVVAPPAQVGVPWRQVNELKFSVDRLHQLTLQLHRVLCG